MLFSSLWNLTVLLLLSPRTLLLSWMISFSINVCYTQEFRRLATSGNTVTTLAYNEVGSTGSWYSSTPLQVVKCVLSSSSVPHDRTDAHTLSIFSGFVDSPPPVRKTTLSFLLLHFSSPSVSNFLPSSTIFDDDLPAPQCWPGIWSLWITVFFSSTLILLITLSFMWLCFSWIATDNETGSPSDVLGASLDLFGTIISSLNFSPSSPITKTLLSFIIEDSIICRNGHENIVLHASLCPRSRETVTGFLFTTKGVL